MIAILVGLSLGIVLALTAGLLALRRLERSVQTLRVEASRFEHRGDRRSPTNSD